MPAIYGNSSFGRIIIIDEGEDYKEIPNIRYAYLLVNILLYFGPTIKLTTQYLRIRSGSGNWSQKKYYASSMWLITSIFITFVINNGIRSMHMVDHMYRPVYYHEPKWAYQKYLVTEMESATYANIIIAIMGYFGVSKLLQSIQQGRVLDSRLSIILFNSVHIFGALFNLVHYTIEPPWIYGPLPNFTISGAIITTFPFIGLLVYTVCCFKKGKSGTGSGSGGKRSKNKEQKEKLLQDYEPSTHAMSTRSSSSRQRSKTPVKSSSSSK